ncbi:MAG: MBL fold metallo-hydrolase [Candidatus Micrarchaeales archaeon]|jgi:L-ascorbate metabolism protein UlaG (beta-lactamase superfamily)
MELDFLKWIEHAGFLIEINGKKAYIDPFMVNANLPKADVIFITHSHFDHLSENDISKLSTAKTQFVVPVEAAGRMSGRKLLAVEPGKKYEIDGIHFSTVPAYNIGKEFHPKSTGGVGYIIDANGVRIYHAGDTDLIDEMKSIDVDVALLPIGGHYTMGIEDAIRATKIIRAKVFIPIHYKAILGKEESAKAEDEFRRRVKNSVILEQIQEPRYSLH